MDLTKDGHRAEARRAWFQSASAHQNSAFMFRASDGRNELLWSQVFEDARQVAELAEAKKREFEAKGWVDEYERPRFVRPRQLPIRRAASERAARGRLSWDFTHFFAASVRSISLTMLSRSKPTQSVTGHRHRNPLGNASSSEVPNRSASRSRALL